MAKALIWTHRWHLNDPPSNDLDGKDSELDLCFIVKTIAGISIGIGKVLFSHIPHLIEWSVAEGELVLNVADYKNAFCRADVIPHSTTWQRGMSVLHNASIGAFLCDVHEAVSSIIQKLPFEILWLPLMQSTVCISTAGRLWEKILNQEIPFGKVTQYSKRYVSILSSKRVIHIMYYTCQAIAPFQAVKWKVKTYFS